MDVRSSKVIKLIKDGEVFLKIEEHPFSTQGTDIELNNYYTYSRLEVKRIVEALQQRLDDLEAADQAIRDESEAMMEAACSNIMWTEDVTRPKFVDPRKLEINLKISDDEGLGKF